MLLLKKASIQENIRYGLNHRDADGITAVL